MGWNPTSMAASAYTNSYMKQINASLDVIKEPRGFIKTLQIFLAILAFATTTGFSTKYTFTAKASNCHGTSTISADVSYPFSSEQVQRTQEMCGNGYNFTVSADVSSDSRFYVAVGVIAMLYSILALVVYLFYNELYESKKLYPCSDFAVHVLLTVLWFTSVCSWSAGVNVLKTATDLSQGSRHCPAGIICTVVDEANFAKLNFSLIIGFLNVFVWGANLWFLFKETPWFSMSTNTQQSSSVSSPSSVTISA